MTTKKATGTVAMRHPTFEDIVRPVPSSQEDAWKAQGWKRAPRDMAPDALPEPPSTTIEGTVRDEP